MPKPIVGLHHVTAIASDPQTNLDFYTEVLGLRLVKRTVNFDDPGSYHFYFGDDTGAPGTILTFFPWPRSTRGTPGIGEVTLTAFSAPLTSIDFWEKHLSSYNLPVERGTRFEETVLTFPDPDSMKLEIVGHAQPEPTHPPRYASVPVEHSLRGFFGVTLSLKQAEETVTVLNTMGFTKRGEEGNRLRFAAEGDALGNHIDLLISPDGHHGRMGAGTVHHIAFRASDDASQLEWREILDKHLDVTPVLDRTYFHSIYFREPGGVLFELATDPPGFLFDEPVESLGEALRIPSWLEQHRPAIEQRLPPIELHKAKVST
jgi:glyoxalase family protein